MSKTQAKAHAQSTTSEQREADNKIVRIRARHVHHNARFHHATAWELQPLIESHGVHLDTSYWAYSVGEDHAFRKWRFARLRFRQKALADVAKRLVQKVEKSVRIAFGDWNA
ncbi:hypothetical protein PybrP1_007440 [[Pythium] brassicae (nom. inval.)]|nr:hypothetical protein PybrP1_007440 [[Pythium] brassicae (nom. inval.)]